LKVIVSKSEVDSLLGQYLLTKYPLAVQTVKENVSLNGSLVFSKRLGIGDVKVACTLANENGEIVITITQTSIAGISIAFLVRKKAGEMIVDMLNKYVPILQARKEDGLVKVKIPGMTVNKLGITGETLLLDISSTTL
jgi:hypothetical protein